MKQVTSLGYSVIFKKAFSQPAIFTAFVRDIVGIEVTVGRVEVDTVFPNAALEIDPKAPFFVKEELRARQESQPAMPRVDLLAQDAKRHIFVNLQQSREGNAYKRYFYEQCLMLMSQAHVWPRPTIYTVVVLGAKEPSEDDVTITDFDPKDDDGKPMNEILHKIIYLAPNAVSEETPANYCQWLQAIADTEDGVVDESQYQHPQILRLFDLIAPGQLSPEERDRMLDEG